MIVADTHVVIWLATDRKMLSKAATNAVETARRGDGIAICDATLYELAWLITNRRVVVAGSLDAFLNEV